MATSPPDKPWKQVRALVIGRATPEPSKAHIETVCTGAITEDGQLLRLYPISYRYLEEEQKYKLWSWASFEIQRNPRDKRKESFRVRESSIRVLSTVTDNSERFRLLKPAFAPHREQLEEMYRRDWTSIGVVEIELLRLECKPQKKNWEKDKPYVKQFNLYTAIKPLTQIPFEMRIRYRCKNNEDCKGHSSTLLGWEYMATFRKLKAELGSSERAFEEVSTRILDRFADPKKLAYALLGTHYKYPEWMVAQIYWFDRDIAPRLF
jgi:hypothetical protein